MKVLIFICFAKVFLPKTLFFRRNILRLWFLYERRPRPSLSRAPIRSDGNRRVWRRLFCKIFRTDAFFFREEFPLRRLQRIKRRDFFLFSVSVVLHFLFPVSDGVVEEYGSQLFELARVPVHFYVFFYIAV